MKKPGRILIAFFLNFFFSIFEFFGGVITGSIAIMSDAVHDALDAFSIAVSYFFERKSFQKPDQQYTYGYRRYSVLGALLTTVILLVGSIFMMVHAVERFFHPTMISYDGMLFFAIIGVIVNLIATTFLHADSLNEKAVSLHLLEDVLGWVVVLVGSILMKFTNWYFLDSVLCILVSCFIFYEAFQNFEQILSLLLERVPKGMDVSEVADLVCSVPKVKGVHHIHLWSMDGENVYLTMHVVSTLANFTKVKKEIRHLLLEHHISHVTIEMEEENDACLKQDCSVLEEKRKKE